MTLFEYIKRGLIESTYSLLSGSNRDENSKITYKIPRALILYN